MEGLHGTCHYGAGGRKRSTVGARIHYRCITSLEVLLGHDYKRHSQIKVTWFKTLQDEVSLRIPLRIPLRINIVYWISSYSEWTGVGMQPLLFRVPSASFSL